MLRVLSAQRFCNPVTLYPCLRRVSFIGRNKKEFVAKHDDVGLGSANESVRFLYRGKLALLVEEEYL
jgi:hypothetical protein